jgi:hypothetical protein
LKLYIYTIPKSGTYFLASLIGRMGYENTGYHINATDYLDTLNYELETNRESPHKTERDVSFLPVLQGLKDRQLAFGHFPAAALPGVLPQYKFVCAYRHPKKTLVSEFIDFRFRRKDVDWITPAAIPNDNEAFETYLRRHGIFQEKIFANMLSVSMSVSEPSCTPFAPKNYHFLNFDEMLANPKNSIEALAEFLEFESDDMMALFQETQGIETKTKATSILIDREKFWTPEALELYESRSFDAIIDRGIKLGWDLKRSSETRLLSSWRLKFLQATNRVRLAFAQ